RCAILLFTSAMLTASVSSAAQDQASPPPAPPAGRTPEELQNLASWVGIVKDPNFEDGLRTFNAVQILKQDWPEARQAVLQLLDNSDGSRASVHVCRAIASNPPPRPEFLDLLLKLLADADASARSEAGKILMLYNDPAVVERLLVIARGKESPTLQRSAAVETLTLVDDSQRATGILVSLLDSLGGQINHAVFSALSKVSGEQWGHHPQAWRVWWAEVSALTREQWLERQLRLRKQREASLAAQLSDSTARLADAYAQLYSKATNGEKTHLIKSLLVDDFEIIRLRAIDIIRRRIGDGGGPDREVIDVVRAGLTDSSANVRKGVLNILANLRNPDDAQAIIALLADEKSVAVRLSGIAALGQLANPSANNMLIAELARNDNSLPCQIAAARSIGRINTRGSSDATDLDAVVTALTQAYEQSGEHLEMKNALLLAMASVAHPEFEKKLLNNLAGGQANIRARCIGGLRQMGTKSSLDAIQNYAGDSDVAVRKEVASAFGELGAGPTHLSIILGRLDPDAEPDSSVREILWVSFGKLWGGEDAATRLSWAKKLGRLPDLQLELLKILESELAGSEPPSVHAPEVKALLAAQADQRRRFEESSAYWADAAELHKQAGDSQWTVAALSSFGARLRAGLHRQAAAYAKQLLTDDLELCLPQLRDEIIAALNRARDADDSEEVANLLDMTKSGMPEILDGDFKLRLAPFEPPPTESATDADPPPKSTPPDGEDLSVAPQNDG
ncbi:MAG: HEAT repeat domain-containing protein, partial [Planctomycetes bacterium]|nr:HEAT repeat domain-containing protein [Planctomycetota bacterium]